MGVKVVSELKQAWQRIAVTQLQEHFAAADDVRVTTFDYDNGLAAQVHLPGWAYSEDFDGDLASVMSDHGLNDAKIGLIAGDYLGGVLTFHLNARRREIELKEQGDD